MNPAHVVILRHGVRHPVDRTDARQVVGEEEACVGLAAVEVVVGRGVEELGQRLHRGGAELELVLQSVLAQTQVKVPVVAPPATLTRTVGRLWWEA